MSDRQIAKSILNLLAEVGGEVSTSYLLRQYGDRAIDALNILSVQQKIIRVRGVGATIALA